MWLNMHKYLFFSLGTLFCLSFTSYCQNKTYSNYFNEVDKYLQIQKFSLAKINYVKLNHKSLDPGLRVQFAKLSMLNGDVEFFKKEAVE